MREPTWIRVATVVFSVAILSTLPAAARQASTATDARSSRNMSLLGHLPMQGEPGAIAFDQQEDRPFVYVSSQGEAALITAVDVSDAQHPQVRYRFGTREAAGANDITTFVLDGSTYVVQAVRGNDANPSLAGVVLDVTAIGSGQLASRLSSEGGFDNLFTYRHSNGNGYLFAAGGNDILVFDLADLTHADVAQADPRPIARISLPEDVPNVDYGFYDMYAAWEGASETDRLYAAGAGGYYVFDITDPRAADLVAVVNDAAVQIGRAITATPDGTHIVTAAGYRAAPLRIYDLRPVFEGTIPRIRAAIGAWTANWRNYSERHQMRWPLVFVASQADGLQVFNMRNPIEPFTAAWFHTWDGAPPTSVSDDPKSVGALDVDVRNSDGMIAVMDVRTGLWLVSMEELTHWDGRGYGFPNVSTVQDWTNGPRNSTAWPTARTDR